MLLYVLVVLIGAAVLTSVGAMQGFGSLSPIYGVVGANIVVLVTACLVMIRA